MNPKKHIVKYRRKLEGKTHYRKRLKLLKSGEHRAVVRPTTRDTVVQFVSFKEEGDNVVISVNNKDLKKMGWKYPSGNLVTSYLIGIIAGAKAKKKGIKKAVLDFGLQPNIQYSRVYAALKGLIKAGINVPHSKEVLPADDRINGDHIIKYYAITLENKDKYKNQFSKMSKEGFSPENYKKSIQDIISKILGKEAKAESQS